MAISDLNQFLARFFQAHHCQVTADGTQSTLTVKLTEEMDKALMNRPFYWHYIKKIGQVGEPKQLTFHTGPKQQHMQGEHIHFGSPRLQQIISHLKTNERFARLYQHLPVTDRTPLYPWLVTNIKLSYIGKQKREQLFSIGLNLVNGVMKTEMMAMLQQLSLQPAIPDFCYAISPMIKPVSGYRRILAVLDQFISDQDHEWAEQSLRALDDEKKLLQAFYEGESDDAHKQMKQEIAEISQRYQPRISIDVVNGGIFYLIDNTFQK